MSIQHVDGFFKGKDGVQLYEQCWMPGDVEEIKAVIVLVHGLAEHGGRYAAAGEFFANQGFAVAVSDLRSHGKSEGKDTEFSSMDDLVEDIDHFVHKIKERLPQTPIFLYGHSMGGTIATLYTIKKQPQFLGVLLTGAALITGDSVPKALLRVVGILGKLVPKMKTMVLDGSTVSKDPAVVDAYNTDPLNYRKGIPACTGAAFNAGIAEAQTGLNQFKLPVLIMHGSEDRLVDAGGSQYMYEHTGSQDKQLKIYQGLYHELLNEPEKEEVMNDMLAWMEAHLG